jgi:hypothetical protein
VPPVIFEAGFSLQKRPFFANLATIVLFAVPGTLLTMLAIGLPLYAIGSAGAFRDASSGTDALDFRSPLDAYVFAACVSATDPVRCHVALHRCSVLPAPPLRDPNQRAHLMHRDAPRIAGRDAVDYGRDGRRGAAVRHRLW